MLVGAQGRWNPNSINFISERQRGQVHIKLECSRSSAGHLFSRAPYSLGRENARRLSEPWLGMEAGLDVCPCYIVEEERGKKVIRMFST